MQREPIQLGAMGRALSKRTSAGAALSDRTRELSREVSASTVLDEVFATYSRVVAGSSKNGSPATSIVSDLRTTRELIADISLQLKTLDSQRRQLARLLQSVDTNTTV
jgi:hypothetical protein